MGGGGGGWALWAKYGCFTHNPLHEEHGFSDGHFLSIFS